MATALSRYTGSRESFLDSPCGMNSSLTGMGKREVIPDGRTKISKNEEDSIGMFKKQQDLRQNWKTGYV